MLAILIAVLLAAPTAQAAKPRPYLPIAGCPDYCSGTACSTIDLSYVCTEEDGELTWNTCRNTTETAQSGTKCCSERTICCTYIDSKGHVHRYYDTTGSTQGCGPQ
jgi:hypothetical protein